MTTTTANAQEEESPSDDNTNLQQQSSVNNTRFNMSLTYSDFIYPREQLDSGNQPNSTIDSDYDLPSSSASALRSNLPNEFQVIDLNAPVPLLQNMDDVNKDFILISEFSELQGPIPLITIPINALEKTDINLNTLSVHVMFTDYQVNTVGQFKVCQDTQVMRTNVFKNVHVFMQYFTLNDIKARGFVRPFCFGYITKDNVKLENNLEKLIHHFNNITTILKSSNRIWFQGELTKYLNKLNNAKNNYPFIRSYSPPFGAAGLDPELDGIFHRESESYNSETIDLDSCGDTVSLQQIEHQFHEIGNIFRIIEAAENNQAVIAELDKMKQHCLSNPNSDLSLVIAHLNFIGNSFEELRLPFVHPLKRKNESLRPLTLLGQYGVVIFIQKLLAVQNEFEEDLIFSEMTHLTDDFRKATGEFDGENDDGSGGSEIDEDAIDISTAMSGTQMFASISADTKPSKDSADLIEIKDVCQILQKLHFSCPIISPDENKSDSFITLSDDSGGTTDYNQSAAENETCSYQTAFGSVDSRIVTNDDPRVLLPTSSPVSTGTTTTGESPPLKSVDSFCSTTSNRISPSLELITSDEILETHRTSSDILTKLTAGSSSNKSMPGFVTVRQNHNFQQRIFSSDEDSPIKTLKKSEMSSNSNDSSNDSSIVEIEKKHWWTYAAKTNFQKCDPGYGLLRFFRHFHSTAHHVLYSILMGRPVVIFGKESTRHRILQIFNCLVPFIPSYPRKSFKLLQWHQGILVPTHFQNFKCIGLCLPERLTIHDLINPHESNCVTILDYENKKLSGPAYSGYYFENFSNSTFCQTKFFDDLSLLTYIGSILTEIETQVYMCKTMLLENEENDYDNFKSIPRIMKQLSLKGSDAEIIKYLSHLLIDGNDSTEIF